MTGIGALMKDTALELLGESVTLFQEIPKVGPKEIPSISYNHQQFTFAHSPLLNPDNFLKYLWKTFDKPSVWMMQAGLYFAVFSMIVWIISVIIFVINGIYT